MQLPPTEATASLIRQRMYFRNGDWFYTPLHVAAQYGNISAIELLLESGADIDECDSNHLSTLECILTQHFADGYAGGHITTFDENMTAAVRLVQMEAATGVVLSWPSMLLLDYSSSSADLSELLFKQTPMACPKQAPFVLDRATIISHDWVPGSREDLLRLQHFVPEFGEDDFGGKSLMHNAICWCGYSELPPR